MGNHILYCGDTSDQVFIDKAPRATFAFADPPYGVGADEWDEEFEWKHDWLIEKSDVVAVTPGIESIFEFAKITKMPYKWSVACWIDNGVTRGALGFGNWIYIALFSNKSLYRNSQDFVRVSIRSDFRGKHKGKKPLDLMIWLLERFSNKGDYIIDPFLGSGTTLFTCEKLGRKCYGGEINPEFCEEIIEKWSELTGEEADVIELSL